MKKAIMTVIATAVTSGIFGMAIISTSNVMEQFAIPRDTGSYLGLSTILTILFHVALAIILRRKDG